MKKYTDAIAKLVNQAREHADRLADSESDKQQARSQALESFADELENVLETLTDEWENAE